MKYQGDFRRFAKELLAGIFADPEYGPLYERLCEREPGLADVSKDHFSMEYLGAKLALSARSWEALCEESGIHEKDTLKVFFQSALDCFQSPKMTPLAASFSDCYYASEGSPPRELALSLTGRLVQRMVSGVPLSGKSQERLESVKLLLETLEGFRGAFENRFHDFLIASLGF